VVVGEEDLGEEGGGECIRGVEVAVEVEGSRT
jgi:hypothetical protein